MPTLSADLELQVDQALSNIGSLDDALEQAASRFSDELGQALEAASSSATAQPLEIPVTADTSEADAAIAGVADAAAGAGATVPIEADASAADAAVEGVATLAEAEHPVIPVDADTSDAEAAISELGGSAGEASGALHEAGGAAESFGEQAGLLAGGAELATGHVSGLSEAAAGVGLSGHLGTVGVLALAGGVGELVHEGLSAESAIQRFNTIVGDMADEVQHVSVGSLNADLGELGRQFGSTDAEMKNATASLFQFALNSGASRQQAASFSSEVAALAARAVALNPALGNVSDVAENMAVRLARGGRFAASFGLALTASEIASRASADANGKDATQLTIFEKSQAAANIAVERYGQVLGHDVAEGAKNAANEQKSLRAELTEILEAVGRPLVAPFLATFRESLPAVQAMGTALGEVAQVSLPLIQGGIEAAVPVLQTLADVVGTVSDVTGSLGISSTIAGAAIGAAFGGLPGAVLGGLAGLASDLGLINSSLDDFDAKTAKSIANLRQLSQEQATRQFLKLVEDQLDHTNKKYQAFNDITFAGIKITDDAASAVENLGTKNLARFEVFQKIAQADKGQAQIIIDGLKAQGIATDDLEGALRGVVGAEEEHKAANGELAASYADPHQAAIDFVATLAEEKRLHEEIENALLGLPGAQLNYAAAVDRQNDAQAKYNDALARTGPLSDETQRAARALDGANQDVAKSALALDAATGIYNDTLNNQSVPALDNEIGRLQGIIATSPAAAAALQPQIDKLAEQRDRLLEIEAHRLQDLFIGVRVEGGNDLAQVVANLNALPEDVRVALILAGGASEGGVVPGSGNQDTVPMLLTPGEFVISKKMLAQMKEGGGGPLPIAGGASGSGALIGGDFNVTVQAPVDDGKKFTQESARALRTEAHLAGWG